MLVQLRILHMLHTSSPVFAKHWLLGAEVHIQFFENIMCFLHCSLGDKLHQLQARMVLAHVQ